MTPNLSSTSGTGANITSELALGADYTFDQDRTIDVQFRLSSLTGTAANLTYLLRLKSSGGAKIAEFPPSPSAITKRATADTVFGDQIRRVFGKSGEKLELRVLSSNGGDTSIAWERDVVDADFANVGRYGGTDGTFAGGRAEVSLAATDLSKLLGFVAVTWINTTDVAKTVIEAAVTGPLCILAPGTHAVGNNTIYVPAGVSVMGCGVDVTLMTQTYTTGVSFKPGSKSRISDFTLQNTAAGIPFGADIPSGSFQNALIERFKISSTTAIDGVYIANGTTCTAVFRDVIIESPFDHFVVSGGSHVFTLERVWMNGKENSSNDTNSGIRVQNGGSVFGHDVQITLRTGTGTVSMQCLDIQDSTSVCDLHHSTFTLIGTAATTNQAVSNTGSATIVLVDCNFDRSKVSGAVSDIAGDLRTIKGQVVTATGAFSFDAQTTAQNTIATNLNATVSSRGTSTLVQADIVSGGPISTTGGAVILVENVANLQNNSIIRTSFAAGARNAGDVTGVYAAPVLANAPTGGSVPVTFTQAAVAIGSTVVSSGTISCRRGDTMSQALTGLGLLTGRTKLWFAVKSYPASDNDAASIIFIEEAGGLTVVQGAPYATASDGAVAVTDATAGNITITLKPAASKLLTPNALVPPGHYSYDVQMLVSGVVTTLASGSFRVVADVVRAIS